MDTTQFEDRVAEIEEYIGFLELLDREAKSGPPTLGGQAITTRQQRMLYSSVYLQLYNLVEATATWCISAMSRATAANGAWGVKQLDLKVRQEWLRTNLRTHVPLGEDKRYSTSIAVCEGLLVNRPIEEWKIESGGGGNWDDTSIESVSERVGCALEIAAGTRSAALRPYRNDKNALRYVKELRNKLAHGLISFEESGEGTTVGELVDLKTRTVDYLRAVVRSFKAYLDGHMYLDPAVRPGAHGAP